MSRFDVTTFGESGLRLSVPAGNRMVAATQFDVHVAGAEGNVIAALAQLGWQTVWVSGLPDTPPGQQVARAYRSAGVDTSAVIWQDNTRVAIFYVEFSTPPRPTQVYYDRKQSCVNQLTPNDIDLDMLLDTRLIHLTGITVPLSDNCRTIVLTLLKEAKKRGITTSFDVNYRSLLWTPDEANAALKEIFPLIDILFCSYRDAKTILNYTGDTTQTLQQLADDIPAQYIVMSDGENGVLGWDGSTIHHVSARKSSMIDRVGAGDGLAAGVIHGWLQDDFLKGLQYGIITAALAMTQYGDIVITSSQELETLLSAESSDIKR